MNPINIKAPILICGCPGSGTSLVTKMLRHAGLFTGADSGPVNARKHHESQCFKRYNQLFLEETISFSHAPKSVRQFSMHNYQMTDHVQSLAQLVDRRILLDEYWDAPDILKTKPDWGWKDPRNSATAMIWKKIFPELRVLVIGRDKKRGDAWRLGGTDAGKWYRRRSTAALRKLYVNPIGLESTPVLRVEFHKLTSDAKCLGDVLAWCGLSREPMYHFQEFLDQVAFEK